MLKRKIEYQRDDDIFKSEKKIHTNNQLNDNIYEFKDFEILKKHVTLFNRKIRQQFNRKNQMEIEKDNEKKKFGSLNEVKNEFTPVINREGFGKINNITINH